MGAIGRVLIGAFFLTSTIVLLFSLLCINTYWLVMPTVVGSAASLSYALFHGIERSDISLPRIVKKAVKSRVPLVVFLVLFLTYLVLYCLFPLYIMPFVDGMKRKELRMLVQRFVNGASNDEEKAYRIYQWVKSHLANVYKKYGIDNYIVFLKKPPFICLRLRSDKYPLWVLVSRCGACMEYSLLYRELAAVANLTVRSVHNPGEDHNWDEVLVNSNWIIVDPSWPCFNPPPGFYERGRRINVSYVYAEYSNGTRIDVTERYTDTGILVICVVYANGRPVKNAAIEVFSLNLDSKGWPISGLNCVTDDRGLCLVRLGGGKYRIRVVVIDWLTIYFGEAHVELAESTNKNITIILRELNILSVPAFQVVLEKNIVLQQALLMSLGFLILLVLHTCIYTAVTLLIPLLPKKTRNVSI